MARNSFNDLRMACVQVPVGRSLSPRASNPDPGPATTVADNLQIKGADQASWHHQLHPNNSPLKCLETGGVVVHGPEVKAIWSTAIFAEPSQAKATGRGTTALIIKGYRAAGSIRSSRLSRWHTGQIGSLAGPQGRM